MKKRVLSLFMALALCLTLLPTAALAETVNGAARNGRDGTNANDPYIVGEDTAAKDAEKSGEALGTALLGSISTQAGETHKDHPICGKPDECTDPNHKSAHRDDETWTAWNGTDAIQYDKNNTAYVYLTDNVEWNSYANCITVRKGYTLYLCLNGKTITSEVDSRIIFVEGKLILSDCSSNGSGTLKHGTEKSGGVTAQKGGTFIMYGGTITGNESSSDGGGVTVSSSNFIMYGGTISGNESTDSSGAGGGGGVYVIGSGSKFEMYGGTISDNTASGGRYGGGVYVSGTFIMHNGTITGNNTATNYGGGVYVSGTFTMYKGTVTGNNATGNGGGVHADNGSTFKMSGGEISGNTSGKNGGGVFAKGNVTISGGTISGNKATGNGGGVYYYAASSSSNYLTVSDTAEIKGNSATDGGGIYVYRGKVDLTGGTITENNATGNGGGVYYSGTSSDDKLTVSDTAKIEGNNATGDGGGVYYNNGTLKVSGSVSITGNKGDCVADTNGKLTNGKTNNVYLPDGKSITITGALTGASIGVTSGATPDTGKYVTVAKLANNVEYTEGSITPDAGSGYTIVKEDNEVNLYNGGPHKHPVCGKTCGHTGSAEHNDVKWNPVSQLTDITAAGYYYLTDNVTLTSTWSPANGVVLCLNGYSITMENSGAAINLSRVSTLTFTLTDCKGTNGEYGKITHAENTKGRGVYVDGTNTKFIMYGGNIYGNTVATSTGDSCGVSVGGGASFTMYGGKITNNKATTYGGGVGVYNSTFNLYGGTISGNTATNYGGGVYVASNSTMTVSGNVTITDNNSGTDGSTTDNVYLPDGKTITVVGALTTDASIGVRTIDLKDGFVTVANGTGSYQLTDDDLNAFSSDAGYSKRLKDNSVLFTSGTLHEHAVCGKTCDHETNKHDSELWQPISSRTDLLNIKAAGHYYLTRDINTYEVWKPADGVVLCLNGCSIWDDDSNSDAIVVDSGVTFTLTDCKGTNGKYGKITSRNGRGVYVNGQNAEFIMYGGNIYGNTTTDNGGGVGVNDRASFTMYGGTISGNKATGTNSCGGGVYVSAGTNTNNKSTFTMYGGTISGNEATGGSGGGVYVYYSTFTMENGTIGGSTNDGNKAYGKGGGGVYVYNGTFTMKDGSVSGNSTDGSGTGHGGGVYVESIGGTFDMTGGTVSGNTAKGFGGGVYVEGANSSFTMSGSATISGNTAESSGGGVYVESANGSFTMNGGTISGNKATGTNGDGGGVCVTGTDKETSTFTMNNGTISGNTAKGSGGGVYAGNSKFEMKNGTISGNTAKGSGGGAYVTGNSSNSGTFNMAGGTITGNNATYTGDTGGGAYVSAYANMTVSGSVQIKDNWKGGTLNSESGMYAQGKNGTASNLCLCADKTVTIGSTLSGSIGVTTGTAPEDAEGQKVRFATGAADNTDYTTIFTPDVTDKGYVVIKGEGGNLFLTKHTHSWTYTANGATITAACGAENCPNSDGGSVTIKAPEKSALTYDGSGKAATVERPNWTASDVSGITYQVKNGENSFEALPEGETVPTNAGTYKASITVGNATASVTYTIAKADPAADDFTFGAPDDLTYNGQCKAANVTSAKNGMGDITVKYYQGENTTEPKNAGTYTVEIAVATGGNYNATTIDLTANGWTFTILQKHVTAEMIADISAQTYIGSAIEPEPIVKDGEKTLTKGTDYTVAYSNNTNAGTAAATITGTGNYSGTAAKNFTIEPKPVTVSGITAVNKTYDGTITATLNYERVTFDGKLEGDTLTVTAIGAFADANAGENKQVNITSLTLDGASAGNYTLAATGQQTETSASISPAVISIGITGIKEKTYDGNASAEITGVTITGLRGSDSLEEGTDYTVSSKFVNVSTGEPSADAGQNKPVIVEIKLKDSVTNYTFRENKRSISESSSGTIKQATPVITAEASQTITKNGVAVDISGWASFNNTDDGAALTYALADEYTGITLEGTTLKATPATTATAFTIKVNAAATTNFTAPVEKTITVNVVEKADAGVVITGLPVSKTYGDADFTITATKTSADTGGTWSWSSSDPTVLEIVSGAGTATPTIRVNKAAAVGATLTVTYTSDTHAGSANATIIVAPKPVTITGITAANKEYDGDTTATAAGTAEIDGKVGGDDVSVIAGTAEFNDKNVGAGKTVTFSGYSLSGTAAGNYTLSGQPANVTADITAKGVTVTGVTATDREYVGGNIHVTVGGGTVSGAIPGDDVMVDMANAEGTMADANVGNSKAVTVTGVALGGTAAGNYILTAQPTAVTVNITKADAPELADVSIQQKYTVTTGEKAIGRAGMPDDAGALTYAKGTESKTGSVMVTSWDVDPTGKVTYILSNGAADDTVTLPVTIASTNYEDAIVNVVIILTAREDQAALTITGDSSVVYGRTLTLGTSGGSGSGVVTYTVANGTGEATIDANGVLTPTKVGSVTVTAHKAGDSAYNAVNSAPFTVIITQAASTGAPKYTAITSGGKTLGDAALTITGSTLHPNAGTLEWVDENGNVLPDTTVVEANKTYQWRFTPDDTNYASLTGSVELYHVTHGGGGSSAPTITVPVTGSRDTVQVSASVSNGTAAVEEIKEAELEKIGTDSSVTVDLSDLGQSVTGVKLPTDTLTNVSKSEADGMEIKLPHAQLHLDRETLAAVAAQSAGREVQLVVETDRAAKDTMTAAQKQALDGMKNAAALEAYFVSNGQRIRDFNGGEVELSIPYQASGAIRAWYLKEDGTREPVSAHYDKENARLILRHFSHYVIEEVESGMGYAACAKDAACPLAAFADLAPAAWYHDGVHYCIENGLMQGVSTANFLPNGSTTRAQLVTILWRLKGSPETVGTASFSDVADGAWYAKAVCWAADRGVVKGYENGNFGPDDAVTREQMVTILYRYAQYKGYDVSVGEDMNILSFNDALTVRGYAVPAMQWACGSGLVTGIAQDGGMLLAPKDTTTRVQAATLMMRFQGIFNTAG